ncbi:MAG: hypothetical protein HYY26_01910 [Acidobacteria bacterium]|nr:hypothetical protein [Acidobacteriota bacterium]
MSPACAPPVACSWLEGLAAGYLRDYRSISREERRGVWGFRFEAGGRPPQAGFFAGFAVGTLGRLGLALTPPECLVFAYVRPAASPLHRRLVRPPGSLFRRSYDLLTKYTGRRPRFEFHEKGEVALLRHVPLALFPPQEQEKYARNFFIESLTLLVRSGLPAALVARGD